MSRYNFKFGDNWISELGAVSTKTPGIEIAQRDFELIEIPGKDGSDYIDKGRYQNVEISRPVSLIGRRDFPVREKAEVFINAMAYLQGYQTFEDTDHDDMFTEAVLTNFKEVSRNLLTLNTATLKFSRKPYWYLKAGFEEITFTRLELDSGVTIRNPFKAPSLPRIRFRLDSGTHTTLVNLNISTLIDGTRVSKSYSYDISWNTANTSFIIDIEKQRLSMETSNGTILSYIEGEVPVCFGPGTTNLTLYSGNYISNVYITPRWRCL